MKKKFNYIIVILVMVVFFIISFITNIIGPVIPEFIRLFDLSLLLASFLPLSFFFAYGVFSIPAGLNMEKYGGKRMIIFGFLISLFGALSISIFPSYSSLIISFFLIGTGMAILQVVINPLLRVAVSGENFAFYSILAQLVFGFASFLSPKFYSYILQNKLTFGINSIIEMPWLSVYWLFVIVSIVTIIIIYFLRFPLIELKSDEKYSDLGSFNYFLNKRITYLYFFGIFAYVGVEQGINNWSSEFLNQYHNLDPNVVGVQVISSYWGNLTIGTIVSLFLIKFFSSRFLLKIYAISSSVLILTALFSSAEYSIFSFKLIGFTISGIWSVMIALGLNSIKEHHGMFSGILISGIVGGAIFPFLIALIGEFMGLKIGMLIIFLGLIYILFVGFVAKPLVSNKTIEMKSK